jgi:hypothetical protein
MRHDRIFSTLDKRTTPEIEPFSAPAIKSEFPFRGEGDATASFREAGAW